MPHKHFTMLVSWPIIKALQRRYKVNAKHLKLTNKNTSLSMAIERLIRRRWSPEQISHCMKLGRIVINGDRPKIIITVQTIYDWIYRFHKELKKFLRHNRGYLHTLTLDNGTENNGYEWIEREIPCLKIYFAHPYHSWERGTNENTNGLLRQYFPKGMDFSKITQAMLDKAVTEINNRPRKYLNWMSPREKMSQNHALAVNKKSCDLN